MTSAITHQETDHFAGLSEELSVEYQLELLQAYRLSDNAAIARLEQRVKELERKVEKLL